MTAKSNEHIHKIETSEVSNFQGQTSEFQLVRPHLWASYKIFKFQEQTKENTYELNHSD